jgi:hypothetical protein
MAQEAARWKPPTMNPDEFLDDKRLKQEILLYIKNGKYRLTEHAAEEQVAGGLDLPDTLHVLKTGKHEKAKTKFEHSTWKYAIKGKTEESQEVRVIIAFSDEMIIITVIDL